MNDFLFGSTNYWFWIGTVYLVFLTYQDYKRNKETGEVRMLVDDRLNFFMFGSTFALLSHVKRPLWYMVSLIVLVLVLGYFLNRFKLVGRADINTIGWIFYGLSIINISYLVTYMSIFVLLSALYTFLKFVVFKYNKPTPFYAVILISFFTNSALLNLYGF